MHVAFLEDSGDTFRLGQKSFMIDCFCLHRHSLENDSRYIRYLDISNLFQYNTFMEKESPDIHMLTLVLYDTVEIVQCIHICQDS